MLNKSALKVIAELEPKYGVELWRYVQYEGVDGEWLNCVNPYDFNLLDSDEYRIKPDTHVINGIECPAPLSVEPDEGDEYFFVDATYDDRVGSYRWSGCSINRFIFAIGNCFATEEDALANFYAHYPHMRGE